MGCAERDAFFMRKCLTEAIRALGWTSPNPLVGCVIVNGGEVVSRGAHLLDGTAHAEHIAIENCPKNALKGSTLYVNLEPCSHQGRTPPCTSNIIEAGIKEVVWGGDDEDPRSAGKAKAILESAGVVTRSGVLSDECRSINRFFFHWQNCKTPFLAAKMATTLDGKIAPEGGSGFLSCEASRGLVHIMRQHFDAVLIGAGTLKADNPKLTMRNEEAGIFRALNSKLNGSFAGLISSGDFERPRDPVAIVLDGERRASPSQLVFDANRLSRFEKSVLLVVKPEYADERRRDFGNLKHVEVLAAAHNSNGRVVWKDLLAKLPEFGIYSVLCEGGSEVFADLIKHRLQNEGSSGKTGHIANEPGVLKLLSFFIAPVIAGSRGISLVKGESDNGYVDRLEIESIFSAAIDKDIYVEYGV